MKFTALHILAVSQGVDAVSSLRGNSATQDGRQLALPSGWYPDWTSGICIFGTPAPGSATISSTNAACCAGQYAWQSDNYCYSQMANPPTAKPTGVPTRAAAGPANTKWYAITDTNGKRKCTVDAPTLHGLGDLNGIQTFDTNEACCVQFNWQSDNYCYSQMANPPTAKPTGVPTRAAAGPANTKFYPLRPSGGDGFCTDDAPSLHGYSTLNGIQTYDTEAACCVAEFKWQTNGFCYSKLANPPTQAPTKANNVLDVWYPNYTTWAGGLCINQGPLPSGRISYSTQAECCAMAYAGQYPPTCANAIP